MTSQGKMSYINDPQSVTDKKKYNNMIKWNKTLAGKTTGLK